MRMASFSRPYFSLLIALIFIATLSLYLKFSLYIGTADLSTANDSAFDGDQRRSLEAGCNDAIWCSIPMPITSFYNFHTPVSDKVRWIQAQLDASQGKQILLSKLTQVFTTTVDFLDGDTTFRSTHKIADVFIDDKNWLTPITKDYRRHMASTTNFRVPTPYDFRSIHRAPIGETSTLFFLIVICL